MPIIVHIPGIGEVDATLGGVLLLLTMASLMVFIELIWMLYLATRVWTMYRAGQRLENQPAAAAVPVRSASPVCPAGTTTRADGLNARPAASADCDALDRALPLLSKLSSSSATVVHSDSEEKKQE